MYRKYVKRFLDILLSFCALLVLWPLIFVIGVAVMVDMGKPILFKQERVGKDEKIFKMYKFRTMNNKCSLDGTLLPDAERITRLGAFLRNTSLDELPELINILCGDISIIGPRPLLPEYLPYYTDKEKQRHQVRGGLTVPEVLYDNIMPTWDEQFQYEIDYAQNVSFVLDVKILIKTVLGVLRRSQDNYGEYVRKSLVEERKATGGEA